jgi:hypothetical protein
MNSLIRILGNCIAAHRRDAHLHATQLLLAVALLLVCGCASSNSSLPKVEQITFTDATGTAQTPQRAMLSVGEGSYMDVAITDDSALLGANWSVTCQSALPPGTPLPPGQTEDTSCGTFSPTHTMSSPIPSYATSATGYVTFYTAPTSVPKGGTVTLYASSTSDPSRNSSATLTIVPYTISLTIATTLPQMNSIYRMTRGTSTTFTAVLINDNTSAGVNWAVTCGSTVAGDCGSFNPVQTGSDVATTYTAPATPPGSNGDVQITATSIADPNEFVTATISIN